MVSLFSIRNYGIEALRRVHCGVFNVYYNYCLTKWTQSYSLDVRAPCTTLGYENLFFIVYRYTAPLLNLSLITNNYIGSIDMPKLNTNLLIMFKFLAISQIFNSNFFVFKAPFSGTSSIWYKLLGGKVGVENDVNYMRSAVIMHKLSLAPSLV